MKNNNLFYPCPLAMCPYFNNMNYEEADEEEEDLYREADDENENEDYEEFENQESDDEPTEDYTRARADIERVMRIIQMQLAADYNTIVRAGIDRRLLNYMVETIVTYIDRNYYKYRGTIQQKVQSAAADIRRDIPWIFRIMQLYGIAPATISRFINSVLRISFENLRRPAQTPPRPPVPPRPPMPRE